MKRMFRAKEGVQRMSDIIGSVAKNVREVILVKRVVYNDRELLDCRVYAGDGGDEAVPTKKGLTLRPATWKELLPILTGAVADGGDSSGRQGRETSEEGAATQG